MKLYGFQQSIAEYSLFTFAKQRIQMAMLVYVNDLILTGNDSNQCAHFKEYLNWLFQIKDLGKLKYFLGIEAARSPKDYS